MAEVAPYGSWRSPYAASSLVSRMVRLYDVKMTGGDIYWVEMRPEEAGRCVIMKRDSGGKTHSLIPKPHSARTLVHEYGGGAYGVVERDLLFVDMADQRLHTCIRGKTAPYLLPNQCRYADFASRPNSGQLLAVREDHSVPNSEAINSLVLLDLDLPGTEVVLGSGHDFYSSPAVSSDGGQVAWLAWDHPNMPWDQTELWTAELDADGNPANIRRLLADQDVSLFQPQWAPNGALYVISDADGWWNIQVCEEEGTRPVCSLEAEFGSPQWVMGLSNYAFVDAETAVCKWQSAGREQLGLLNVQDGGLLELDTPYSEFAYIQAEGRTVAFLGASHERFPELAVLDLDSGDLSVVRRSSKDGVDKSCISAPQAVEFETAGGERAHANYYAPFNPDFRAPDDDLPPLLVKSHGGPTSAASSGLNMEIQYWTSRGYAVVDVDYRGSTGYGTAYRRRLNGQWGILDVEDSVHAARHLVEQGKADPQRKAVMGGSAGGFTTLACLAFTDEFQAGMSRYGVADLAALARDTHKFESRYLDSLIGPYPDDAAVYDNRSPLKAAQDISCPVLFLQGLEDRIVPPSQAEQMVAALRRNGIPVAYLAFEGEQHGFRISENVIAVNEAEEFFLSRIFSIEPADSPAPIEIENWQDPRPDG